MDDTVQRIQIAYGEKFNLLVMFDSKWDVVELIHEDTEERAYKKVRNLVVKENQK